uniref:WD_REPEATS_REGION domain-containing protein n=1 Tax=Mesocestoides corti TaxID=53468 RepID=A0A5K3G4I6_MESCO
MGVSSAPVTVMKRFVLVVLLSHIPISDIVFLDDIRLISVAGDGFLRLWNSVEGIQLDSFDVSSQLQELCGVGFDGSHKTFLASRLIRVGCVALLGIQSHNCILSVRISKDLHAFERANGAIVASGVVCPGGERFIDCCVINHKAPRSFEVVCFTEPISRLISWIVTYNNDSSLIWSQANELDVLPSEWKIKNVQFPRIQMLTDMSKSFMD